MIIVGGIDMLPGGFARIGHLIPSVGMLQTKAPLCFRTLAVSASALSQSGIRCKAVSMTTRSNAPLANNGSSLKIDELVKIDSMNIPQQQPLFVSGSLPEAPESA